MCHHSSNSNEAALGLSAGHHQSTLLGGSLLISLSVCKILYLVTAVTLGDGNASPVGAVTLVPVSRYEFTTHCVQSAWELLTLGNLHIFPEPNFHIWKMAPVMTTSRSWSGWDKHAR